MASIFLVLFLLLGSLLAVVLFRTFTFGIPYNDCSLQAEPDNRKGIPEYSRPTEELIENLIRAIQIRTITYGNGNQNTSAFLLLREYLEQTFPTVHSSPRVTREIIGEYSMLFQVKGDDPSLEPYLLEAHLDVVPAREEDWTVLPFAGHVQNGYVYGRGAMDMKNVVMAIMEAMEFLLKKEYSFRRTLYVSFGHDAKLGGLEGAKEIAKTLESRNVKLAFLLGRGITICKDMIPGVEPPVALIGVAEKGYMTIELSVKTRGGHPGVPEIESSIGILAKAISRIEMNQMPSVLGEGAELTALEHLITKMSLPYRMVMSNLWLFKPIISTVMTYIPDNNGAIRTTAVPTLISGGIKDNVLPTWANATINIRIHTVNTIKEVMDFTKSVISDERVKIRITRANPPSPVSSSAPDSLGYQIIKKSLAESFPEVLAAPTLSLANLDGRHFLALTHDVYRFSPTIQYPEDMPQVHGNDERISIENYKSAVQFYYRLMLNSDKRYVKTTSKKSSVEL
eukprot:m.63835 g.63835  ORF g.63835 m.63835 type:complete len:510 (+) comp35194_c0_seq3:76-1605(+)